MTPSHPADEPWRHGVWDTGLQPERTRLSWQRTALSAAACSLIIARLVGQANPFVGIAVALAAIVCGIMIGVTSRRRLLRSTRAVHLSEPLPDARGFVWMTALIMVAGAGAITLALMPIGWF